MRLSLLALVLVAAPAFAQAELPAPPDPGQGLLVRAGVSAAFFAGETVFAPNVQAEVPTRFGGLGAALATYLVDGASFHTAEVTGSYRFDLGGPLDPYTFASLGYGFGDASGLVYGAEGGVRYWLTDRLAANVYAGYVGDVGSSTDYTRVGAGVAVGL